MAAKPRKKAGGSPARVKLPPGAPRFVAPMAAQPVSELPEGPEWSYELKLDGYRALLIKDGEQVRVLSRNENDLTASYPGVAEAASTLRATQAVVDGEIVALDENGKPSFQALQHRNPTGRARVPIVFYAFDALFIDGEELAGFALEARRERLRVIADGSDIRISGELPGALPDIIAAVRSMGLEGIIAKRRDSLYEPGERSTQWLKLKLDQQQEFVIGGFRPGSDGVDALLVGVYDGKRLLFAAKVRAGFVTHTRREVARQLQGLVQKECPFANLPDAKKSRWGAGITAEEMKVRGTSNSRARKSSRWSGGITEEEMTTLVWVEPELVVQIRFLEWTAEGRLRHASYLGLRPDKAAGDVHREG